MKRLTKQMKEELENPVRAFVWLIKDYVSCCTKNMTETEQLA